MNNVSLGKRRLKGALLISAVLVAGLIASPLSAIAAVVNPIQILPPGQDKTCAPVMFSDINPYIYDDNLDSFDITISDSRYVAISTTVAGIQIPYNYVTRWQNQDGSMRMHVDLASIRMHSDVAVNMVFLATPTDSSGLPITCIMNISSVISALPGVLPIKEGRGNVYIPLTSSEKPSKDPVDAPTTTPTTSIMSNAGLVAAVHSLGKLCANGGESSLWAVLLVLYALFVFVLCAQKVEVGTRSKDWNIALILALFLILMAFWYTSSLCRAGPWAPGVATFIAVLGLLYSTMSDSGTSEVLLLKDSKKK
jgi:hypothetical protein